MQLWVEPALRSQGMGGALLDATERAAAERGASRIWMLGSENARSFYLRRGYVEDDGILDPVAADYVRNRKRTPISTKTLRRGD